MYEKLPVPDSLYAWQKSEVERHRDQITGDDESYTKDGVRYWKSNNAVIPAHVFREAYLVCPQEQADVEKAANAKFLDEYRKSQMGRRMSAEERFEARAAHGPGKILVNVITGQKFRT